MALASFPAPCFYYLAPANYCRSFDHAVAGGYYGFPGPAHEDHYPICDGFPKQPLPSMAAASDFHYFVVVNFRATSGHSASPCPQEVIEFPSLIVNAVTGQEEATFRTYVRPDYNPPCASDFRNSLTGIQLADVERGVRLHQALEMHDRWLEDWGVKNTNFAMVTWGGGDGDCVGMLEKECKFKGISMPGYFDRWINLEAVFSQMHGRGGCCRLPEAVDRAGLRWEGWQDCGLVDARNTSRLLGMLMGHGLRFFMAIGSVPVESTVGPFKAVTWSCPGEGKVKLNFDGAVAVAGAGYGAIIRDDQGGIIATVSGKGEHDSVVATEAQAALSGLRLAKSLGYDQIWVEGDSALVTDWINGLTSPPAYVSEIISKIKKEMEECHWTQATHVLREGNQPADLLAKLGKQIDKGEVFNFEDFSPDLVDLVIQDMCPIFFIRY